jgi:threonyl-tRNA synthetase
MISNREEVKNIFEKDGYKIIILDEKPESTDVEGRPGTANAGTPGLTPEFPENKGDHQ